jgi:endonuclease YncB( thermonuclease family)
MTISWRGNVPGLFARLTPNGVRVTLTTARRRMQCPLPSSPRVSRFSSLVILALSVLSRAVWTSVHYPASYEGTVVEVTAGFQVALRTAAGDTVVLQLAGIDAPAPTQDVYGTPRDATLDATAKAVEQYLTETLVGRSVAVRVATTAHQEALEPMVAHVYWRGPLPGWRSNVSQHLVRNGYAFAYRTTGLSVGMYQRYGRLEAQARRGQRGLWKVGGELLAAPPCATTRRQASPLPSPPQGF